MDEHLRRAGEPTDDAAHLARIRYRACDAHIVLWASVPIGLLKYVEGLAEWEIVQVQILPAYQGQGISKQLLTEWLARADSADIAVSLTVLKGNKAINLYRRLGFQIVTDSGNSFKMKRERQKYLTDDVSADIRPQIRISP
ncbi:GNAT family N-acetyltransferase [Pseudomonas sp. RA_35y_Pfl2_P32]|uniref:GNAT family N-acetyltransferase n=1 Tax=Pseudomonas sp. RA_35y_Pfl2_P32 TaxID=3088705 RepID=UPI0030D9C862